MKLHAPLPVHDPGRDTPTGPAAHSVDESMITDVTHRHQLEQARLETEFRLLQAQKFYALNQLAGGVAHEFNNIVAGILGSAELLGMDLPESHPAHEALKHIFEASHHARDFVQKLRIFGQRPPLEFKLVSLPPIIEECLQILRSIIPDKVELQTRVNPDCARVNADAAQIHQAILDLCLHAWQGLADRRGHLSISLDNCPVVPPPAGTSGLLQPGSHVCLIIQDDSPGLEKSAREHIFSPFRNRRSSGTKAGLELFLVRETIQAHQGEIVLESGPGQGLKFLIYLPAAGGK